MHSSPQLDLADARSIAAAARGEAERRGAAVSIAICDAGGHLLLLELRYERRPHSLFNNIPCTRPYMCFHDKYNNLERSGR